MSTSPNQKFGIATPNSANAMLALSIQVFWRTAASVPSATPNAHEMPRLSTASRSVLGKAPPIISETVWLLRNDRPRSPCSAFQRNVPN